MNLTSTSLDMVTFQANITRACHYQINVHYFHPTDGLQPMVPCVNCYLRVAPAAEEYRRFDFLDARDNLMSVFTIPAPTMYLNKYDWNPKVVFVMRDLYGNLVTTRTGPELAYNYTFDIVQVTTRGTTVLRNGTWEQFRSFHIISFCGAPTPLNEDIQRNTFCFQPEWTTASLRIRQFNRTTNVLMGTATINLQFVDNLGTFYNSDIINPLSANYTYLKVFNQDASDVLG